MLHPLAVHSLLCPLGLPILYCTSHGHYGHTRSRRRSPARTTRYHTRTRTAGKMLCLGITSRLLSALQTGLNLAIQICMETIVLGHCAPCMLLRQGQDEIAAGYPRREGGAVRQPRENAVYRCQILLHATKC